MDTERNVKTGNYIRCLREQKGWTQEELAERVGVSSRTIGTWEAGTGSIKIDNIRKLASVLGVNEISILLGETHDEIDPETNAEILRRLEETSEITIVLEDRGIVSLDIGISAFGLATIAFALAMWAAFSHTGIMIILVSLLGIFGVVFIIKGRTIIRQMEKRLSERKDRTSVSE